MSTLYLTRYGSPAMGIAALVMQKPELIVIIPSYNEPYLLATLDSLKKSVKKRQVVIIPVINHSEGDTQKIKEYSETTFQSITKWALNRVSPNLQVLPILHEFASKKSGVGMARKLGMDEAVRIYEQFEADGLIVNLDADCLVSDNYIEGILSHFEDHPKSPAASISFEHICQDSKEDEAIINYELHLRYFIEMQRFCNLPYAYQTVGSAMICRSEAYQKQGGMNKRKAGEDFYFLQKMMLLGHFTEINHATVYPSSRVSERVPFGTGRAMLDWQSGKKKVNQSYHPQSFIILKTFLDLLPELYIERLESCKNKVPLVVWQFLESQDFHKALMDLKKKSTSFSVFQRHFYNWFDGFALMKFVHYSRDHFYPNEPISYCIKWLFDNRYKQHAPNDLLKCLLIIREMDRKSDYQHGFHSY